ncbi:MAG: bifunctional (p)ppGpp synthetase/guanosine-3',5'-bis(diphosphate) 3'-pyrophosphohydrolase [Gammaproteobacteria bacterium]|nr:bifunctional (p)ppGpp synthetase/guanosine-3',5'-bis(diphosphate) 3'-pyrophosphohydrolase [Gammaproteobacteria bacterium]
MKNMITSRLRPRLRERAATPAEAAAPRAKGGGVEGLLAFLGGYLGADALDSIRGACDFGARAHAGQTRESGEAYIHHPLAVARILGAMRMDSRTIVSAVLHDVLEDTDITTEELRARFGDEVAALVDGVSKVSLLEQETREHAEAASFRKMLMATATDLRVIIIKLADRLHNMRTLDSLRAEKKRRVARQTLEIYAPIANRLGMRDLAEELEDMSLCSLYPRRHRAISKRLGEDARGKKSPVNALCEKLGGELRHAGIPARVHGREKSVYSIYRKMQRKKITLRDMRDIHAIRVITETRPQCYPALGLIHRLYKPRPGSFKDYIAIPKANGYQSLHTVVIGPAGQPVEVQIRSEAMHRVAEQGVASHWLYKTETTGEHAPQQLAQRWLSGFLESQQKSLDSGEFLDHLKADLFPDEVYVTTPKGEIKRLPRGATALDFSYAVHTDIGNRCAGARINRRAVALHEALRNGDHVEIITSRSARPHPAWLNYVVTSRARTSIRHFLKQQKEKESFQLGRKLLKQALARQGYRRLRIPSAHKVALLQRLDMKDWTQLLRDIGYGKRPATLAAKQMLAAVQTGGEGGGEAEDARPAMVIEGTERLLVTHAACCHPIPGDQIIGVMSGGKGLVVHRATCPRRRQIMRSPDSYFHLAWSDSIKRKFQVPLKMETRNEPGVLAAVSNIIAMHGSNISSVQVSARNNASVMSVTMEVADRAHLDDITKKLRAASCVISLARG